MYTLVSLGALLYSFGSAKGTVYPSSCRELEDGKHTLKLMDGDLEDAPLVEVECSNGYTILDVSKDSDLESYFDTFMKFHHSVAGPSNDIHTNWEGWYKADDGTTEYVISPDCNTCEYDHMRQIHKTDNLHKTVYMMTGTMFGCFWNLKGEHNFDEDYNSYQCYYSSGELNEVGSSILNELNDESDETNWDASGVCAFSVRESNRALPDPMSHDRCTVDISDTLMMSDTTTYHLKPSIGTDGEYCVCSKPSTTQYYDVDSKIATEYIRAKKAAIVDKVVKKEETKTSENNIVKLYQSDFKDGTYRILESGTYVIMEDIVFDFNAEYDTPNSDTAWWPHSDQSDEYPGAGDYHNSYFLGFWAGIAIESDDVVLDLNSHEIRMSDVFYHQQRWFTAVSLLSQYFLPGQGIGFFGADPHFSADVTIKNGVIGLSSHHGIHGHFNKNVLIENVHVKDFETHGIQFNGFEGVTIKNCEVGPTSTQSYFKGEYGHARTLLPRFEKIAEENPNVPLHFYGREKATTMEEIVEELKKQTDMAYYHVVEGREYDENDPSWQSAQYLFLDKTNLPNGAAMYGIFLNTYGASVLTYNLYTSYYSADATVIDTKIHDLRHSMNEYVRMQWPASGNLFMNILHAPFDATQVLESVTDFSAPRYKGSVLTDAALAAEKLTDNWNYLQAQLLIDSKMLPWAFGERLDAMDSVQIGCNIDVMIHSGKGISGLRIDGVDGVVLENIEISDLTEETPLGRSECGDYNNFLGTDSCFGACGGHFRQTAPMQEGFSGNMIQGVVVNAAKNVVMKDMNIHDLESKYGQVFGIAIWPATEISLEGNIETSYLHAGSAIEVDSGFEFGLTNAEPEVCGVRVYSEYTSNEYTYTAEIDSSNAKVIRTSCVQGHALCFSQTDQKTTLGAFTSDTKELCEWNKVDSESISQESSKNVDTVSNGAHHSARSSWSSMLKNSVIYLGVFVAIAAVMLLVRNKWNGSQTKTVEYVKLKSGQQYGSL